MNDGITETSLQELLGLSDADVRFIELKVALKKAVKSYRRKAQLTQKDLAKLIDSSQSRIAKLEGGDSSVSIDMMVNCLSHLGVDNAALSEIVCPVIKVPVFASPVLPVISDSSAIFDRGSAGSHEWWPSTTTSITESPNIFATADELH